VDHPPVTRPLSPFLQALRRAIIEDLEDEIQLTCKVAVLRAAGYRKDAEIMRALDCNRNDLLRAKGRLARVAPRLDRTRPEEP
jgi:hypothetical protein